MTGTTGTGRLIVCVAVWLLTACGGGGGGGGSSGGGAVTPQGQVDTGCASGQVARLALASTPLTGRNAELALLACPGQTVTPQRWVQTAGASVNLLSARSAAISIEPTVAGTYAFDVTYLDAQGATRSLTASLPVSTGTDAALTLRGEPSIWSQGQGSIRAWADASTPSSVHWVQLSGPPAQLTTPDAAALIFTAPAVSSDTVIQFRAQSTLGNGTVRSGVFSLLVQAQTAVPAGGLFGSDMPLSRVMAYRPQSPYAQALVDCTFSPGLRSNAPTGQCTLGRLPLLGTSTGGAMPTVDQVMDRVVVSNDWMGAEFERFLREQDTYGDFRRMLASVTAVVIGGRIRPSFYYNATGAIYLDADDLWSTPEQRDTLSEAPDPRSAFASRVQFATPWRYVKGSTHAYWSYSPDTRMVRDRLDGVYPLSSLLYHELTHANDFLPPSVHASLDTRLLVSDASPAITASQALHQQLPFFSRVLQDFASILYFGDQQVAVPNPYGPADAARDFAADRVNDHYSFSVPSGHGFSREDAAMLVEETMMQLRYGVQRDTAITPPITDQTTGSNLLVTWGQRGRVGDPAIRPRVKLVMSYTMPWFNAALVDTLPAPVHMMPGWSWSANLAAGLSARRDPLTAQEQLNEQMQTIRGMRRATARQ